MCAANNIFYESVRRMNIAHIAIDMQFVEKGKYYPFTSGWGMLCESIGCLKSRLDHYAVPTILAVYINDAQAPILVDTFRRVQQALLGWKKLDLRNAGDATLMLPVEDHDLVTTKNAYSACTPALLRYLHKTNVDTIIVSGLWEGHLGQEKCCLTATALDFVQKGFRVIIASEATNFLTRAAYCTAEDRVKIYAAAGIEIMSVEEVVAFAANSAVMQSFSRLQQSTATQGALISAPK